MAQSDKTRIAILETNHINIMDKIDSIIERFDKFEEKLDVALEKKADKETVNRIQAIINWFGVVIGSGILGYIGLQIIKVIEQL